MGARSGKGCCRCGQHDSLLQAGFLPSWRRSATAVLPFLLPCTKHVCSQVISNTLNRMGFAGRGSPGTRTLGHHLMHRVTCLSKGCPSARSVPCQVRQGSRLHAHGPKLGDVFLMSECTAGPAHEPLRPRLAKHAQQKLVSGCAKRNCQWQASCQKAKEVLILKLEG